MKILTNLLLLSILAMAACDVADPTPEEQAQIDRELILEYIAENNLNAIEHSSGLFYIIDNPGKIAYPEPTSTVTVRYHGVLLNGDVFDTTYDDNGSPLIINLQAGIEGWAIGIPLFKIGGKGTLIIPSSLGYGRLERGSIPANSVLVFEQIELVEFQ